MGLPQPIVQEQRFTLMEVGGVPYPIWADYWNDMILSGRINDRFGDTDNPTIDTVWEMQWRFRPHAYLLIDLEEARALGECVLANFSGASAQVHFSVRSGLPLPTARDVGREMIRTILYGWRHGDQPFLRTLYGMLPRTNRAAIIFCLSCGFKRFGTVPYGMRHRGKVCDGVVLIETRRD